jgi:uncharacterized protein
MSESRVPLFPLRTVLFPGGPLPLRIFERRYLDMVRDCLRSDGSFGVVLIAPRSEEGSEEGSEVGAAATHTIGTLAKIVDFYREADGLLGIIALGVDRFRTLRASRRPDGLYVADVELFAPEQRIALDAGDRELVEHLRQLIGSFGELYDAVPKDYDNATWVSYRLAEILPLPDATRQALLEMDDARERLEWLRPALAALWRWRAD